MSRELIARYENDDDVWLRYSSYTRADLAALLTDEWGLNGWDAAAAANAATIVGMRLRDVLGCNEYRTPPTDCRCPTRVPAGTPGSEPYWQVLA